MPTIPTHHAVGDTGHTTDHNLVSDVLNDHETRVTNLQGVQANYLVKTGGNIVTLTNPSGVAERVEIPAGTRDTTVWVKQVTYGGNRTFALDTYGQARLGAATTSEVPLTCWGYDSTHTGDLQRWRQYQAGPIVARVDALGNVFAPNLTPGTWTNLTLASGIAWKGDTSSRPQYRITGDRIELRGAIKKSDGTDFSTSPTTIATLPTLATPPYLMYFIVACELGSGMASVRLEITSAGVMKFYLITASSTPQTPAWVCIDGVAYSKTA